MKKDVGDWKWGAGFSRSSRLNSKIRINFFFYLFYMYYPGVGLQGLFGSLEIVRHQIAGETGVGGG